jgi:AcrR family transcriptional regulator
MTPTRTKIQDKRAAILETTLALLSERGFHDTPMSMIARRSGVSTGIIYHYFSGKEELIYELYREIKLRMLHTIAEGFDEPGTYRERFLVLWRNLIQYHLDHPQETVFLEQFENSPYYKPDWQATFADEMAPLIVFFQQGIQEGVLKDLPIEVIGELSFMVAVSLAKRHIRGAIQLTDTLIDAAANASWDAIERQTSGINV